MPPLLAVTDGQFTSLLPLPEHMPYYNHWQLDAWGKGGTRSEVEYQDLCKWQTSYNQGMVCRIFDYVGSTLLLESSQRCR